MDNQISLNHDSELKLLTILTGFLLLIVALSLFLSLKAERRDNSSPTETVSSPFPTVFLEARAAYVYDIRTGEVLFAQNENTRLPLASLTKVMSALVAQELGLEHNTVTISAEALEAEGDSGLLKDEKWPLRDLLNFSLITSSNDGVRAAALALGALTKYGATPEEIISDFVMAMNGKASKLGLKNTYFWNETGLDLPAQAGESPIKGGAYGSARDFSTLMANVLASYPELFSGTKESVALFQSLDNNSHVARNTNSIVSLIPGLVASKTGYTNTAGGNLSIIFDPELGRPITITVLGSTEDGRFSDIRILVDATLEHLNE